MRNQMAMIEGQVAELRHDLEVISSNLATQRAEIDQRLQTLKGGDSARLDPSQVPTDKEAHFQAAYRAYEANEHDKARALFREYLTRYPSDAKAGNAQYWIGSSYLQQNKPATALGEYRKVIAEHGKSSAVDVALYGMADAFFRLHACTDAKSAVEALLKRNPRDALLQRAKQLQAEIKKAKKGYCTS
jgi:TolA-binding protein